MIYRDIPNWESDEYRWGSADPSLAKSITAAAKAIMHNMNNIEDDAETQSNIIPSCRISPDEMMALDNNTVMTMLRNRVSNIILGSINIDGNDLDYQDISSEAIEWCELNCTDLWCYSDGTLSFLSKEDRTLFIVANSGKG